MARRKGKYAWLAEAASSGGTARWKGVSREERTRYARANGEARWSGISKAERSEAMRQLVLARWKRKKQKPSASR